MNKAETATAVREWGYLVGGEFRASGEPFEVRSPYDDSVVGIVRRPRAADIEEAVRQAQAGFERMSKLPTHRRGEILRAIVAGLEARREELVRMLALEAGKPVKAGRVEADRAVFTFRTAAEESQRLLGEFMPLDLVAAAAGRWGIVRRFPIGPILAITPFNFPLNLVGHKVAPALAAGNSVVQKPATKTPICSLILAEICQAAGLPAGAYNVLPCSAEQAASLVSDDRLKMLTFTGSSDIGWELKQKAGKKRVTLELGGNAGVIVHSDADLDYAAERCAAGGFSYAGQSCIAVQRIRVHRPAWEPFLEKFLARVRALEVGNPLDEKTDVGPMIAPADAQRAESWVKEAVAAGAKILFGGERHGALLQPTVLTGTRREMKVNCLELFAPVVTVEPYDDFGQAIEAVNDSRFGLQAGVFTRNIEAIFSAYEKLEVGGVVVGDVPTFRVDHMPYGGMKDSGTGREGIRYAIEEMTERKILVLHLPG
ncbi:MAG TPA: aldehyde dehydrogenase family protein [Candidatus Acidoferrales bacterium]